jgi:hypothetical protein
MMRRPVDEMLSSLTIKYTVDYIHTKLLLPLCCIELGFMSTFIVYMST